MKKSLKILLITALAFLLIGITCCITALTKVGFDIHKLSTESVSEKQVQDFEIDKNDSISVNSKIGDVKLYPSPDNKLHVQYYSSEYSDFSIQKADDTIIINDNEMSRPWYRYIQLNFGEIDNDIVLQVPSNMINNISITSGTGSVLANGIKTTGEIKIDSFDEITITGINVASLSASPENDEFTFTDSTISGNINISTSYNEISIGNINCGGTFNCSSDSSSIHQSGLLKASVINFSTESGSIYLDKIDATSATVTTESGSITGTSTGSEKDYVISARAESFKNQLGTGTLNATRALCLKSDSGSIDWRFEK